MLTFDLDDTIWPTAPVVTRANEQYINGSKRVEHFPETNVVNALMKGIREERESVSEERRRTRGAFLVRGGVNERALIIDSSRILIMSLFCCVMTGVIVRVHPNSRGGESDDDVVRRVRTRRDWYGRERVPFELDSDSK